MYWPGHVQTICCIVGIIALVTFFATIYSNNIGWTTLGSFLLMVFCIFGYHYVKYYESKIVNADIALITSYAILDNPPATLNLGKNEGTYNYVASFSGECYRCKQNPNTQLTKACGYIYSETGTFSHLECLHNKYKAPKY
jgi:hypothetical protein